jgi:hypothetical protein
MARGLTSYELFAAQRAAANYGRLTSVHTRYHLIQDTPTEAPIAFDEIFTNAMLLDAPLLMAHNNDYGWWEIEEKLQMAREKGLNMWSEYYPYAAGSTPVSADFLPRRSGAINTGIATKIRSTIRSMTPISQMRHTRHLLNPTQDGLLSCSFHTAKSGCPTG